MFEADCRVSKTWTIKPKEGSVDVISYAVEGNKLVGLAVELKSIGIPWHLFHFSVDLKSEDMKHSVTKIEEADQPTSSYRKILSADFGSSITSTMHRGVLTTVFIDKKGTTFVMWIDFSSNPLQPTGKTGALQRHTKDLPTPEPMRLLPSSLFVGEKYNMLVFPHRVYKVVHSATKRKSAPNEASQAAAEASRNLEKPQIAPKLAKSCINLDEYLKNNDPKRGDQLRAIVYNHKPTLGILNRWRKTPKHVLLSGLRVKNTVTRQTDLILQIWQQKPGQDDELAYKCSSIRINSKAWSHIDDEFTMVTAPA